MNRRALYFWADTVPYAVTMLDGLAGTVVPGEPVEVIDRVDHFQITKCVYESGYHVAVLVTTR